MGRAQRCAHAGAAQPTCYPNVTQSPRAVIHFNLIRRDPPAEFASDVQDRFPPKQPRRVQRSLPDQRAIPRANFDTRIRIDQQCRPGQHRAHLIDWQSDKRCPMFRQLQGIVIAQLRDDHALLRRGDHRRKRNGWCAGQHGIAK